MARKEGAVGSTIISYQLAEMGDATMVQSLTLLLAEPNAVLVAVPSWGGAGDQPEGVHNCTTVSVPNAEYYSWWFSISAKYKD